MKSLLTFKMSDPGMCATLNRCYMKGMKPHMQDWRMVFFADGNRALVGGETADIFRKSRMFGRVVGESRTVGEVAPRWNQLAKPARLYCWWGERP